MATSEERAAADRQRAISAYDAETAANELQQAIENYQRADARNAALAEHQTRQVRRKAEADRFDQSRKLQDAAISVLGEMGPTALQGSATGNLLRMLYNRNDADNLTYWNQYERDRDTIWNENEASRNQNEAARDDAALRAESRRREIASNLAANLANISGDLYEHPNDVVTSSTTPNGMYSANMAPTRTIPASGYVMPQDAVQDARAVTPRNRLPRNDYFSRLMNGFNRR